MTTIMDDKLGTRHSDLRVMQRIGRLDKTATELWDEGIDCEVKYHGYDEARVIPQYDVVMLKENNQIVTVLQDTHNVTVEGEKLEGYLDSAIGDDNASK